MRINPLRSYCALPSESHVICAYACMWKATSHRRQLWNNFNSDVFRKDKWVRGRWNKCIGFFRRWTVGSWVLGVKERECSGKVSVVCESWLHMHVRNAFEINSEHSYMSRRTHIFKEIWSSYCFLTILCWYVSQFMTIFNYSIWFILIAADCSNQWSWIFEVCLQNCRLLGSCWTCWLCFQLESPSSDTVSLYKEQQVTGFFALISSFTRWGL